MSNIHYMNLHDLPFQLIKNQTKTIEMRLNDDKRKLINVGDSIVFTNTKTEEKMSVRVINLYKYKDFYQLYQQHDKVSIGYDKDEDAKPEDMYLYYSKENILKYGVVGIEITLD